MSEGTLPYPTPASEPLSFSLPLPDSVRRRRHVPSAAAPSSVSTASRLACSPVRACYDARCSVEPAGPRLARGLGFAVPPPTRRRCGTGHQDATRLARAPEPSSASCCKEGFSPRGRGRWCSNVLRLHRRSRPPLLAGVFARVHYSRQAVRAAASGCLPRQRPRAASCHAPPSTWLVGRCCRFKRVRLERLQGELMLETDIEWVATTALLLLASMPDGDQRRCQAMCTSALASPSAGPRAKRNVSTPAPA